MTQDNWQPGTPPGGRRRTQHPTAENPFEEPEQSPELRRDAAPDLYRATNPFWNQPFRDAESASAPPDLGEPPQSPAGSVGVEPSACTGHRQLLGRNAEAPSPHAAGVESNRAACACHSLCCVPVRGCADCPQHQGDGQRARRRGGNHPPVQIETWAVVVN